MCKLWPRSDTIAPVLMVMKFPIFANPSFVIIPIYSVCQLYVKQSRRFLNK